MSGPVQAIPGQTAPVLAARGVTRSFGATEALRGADLTVGYGEVLAVTDDLAERETVISLGGIASSCWNFIQTIESTLAEQAGDIKDHNRKERQRFEGRK